MRRSSNRCLAVLSPLAITCALASPLWATTAPILDVYGPSLTTVPSSSAFRNPAWARWQQRGVDIDGTLRQPVPLGWSVAGDPLGGGYSSGRTLGDVNLATGSYNPTEIDLALPTLGLPVVIGRTYNAVQDDGAGGYSAAREGYQGWDWYQVAQPQIAIVAGATNDLDVIYLSYGNDRFIEFKRIALNGTEFKAKNGAAGVITFTAGSGSVPELYTYYDQRGDQITFFGFNSISSFAKGQLWKMSDPAGNTAYVQDATTPATATGGYDVSSRIKNIYDASGRKYLFTYSGYSGLRLSKVEAQILVSSVYTTIAQVEYDYYPTTSSGTGSGNLWLVKITMKGVTSGDYVRYKYYRYYTNGTWANSDGSRGKAHLLKMVVGFDGTQQYDYAGDSTLDQDYYSETDANLLPYAESYFEYVSDSDYRLRDVIFNGNCGCAGGTSGTYNFTYDNATSYATDVADTTYQNVWEQRTVITQPDGTYVTQYFDETGAVLGRVTTNADPAGSPTKTWVTDVVRNSAGQVTAIHSPANITGYTHNTMGNPDGTITHSTSAGLVTVYARHSASSNLDGLRDSVSVEEGTSGTPSMTSSVSMTDRQLTVGASAVSIPQVDTTSTYPSGSNLDTTYSYTYWSTTASDVKYIAPKVITTTNPTVTTGNNGSNSGTASSRYLREDRTTAFTKDAGDILFYSGRSAYGQTAAQIADYDGSTLTNIVAEDKPGSTLRWSVSSGGSGTPIQALTTMTYDDQGRILTQTAPSYGSGGSTTRTAAWVYVLDGVKLGTFTSPRLHSGTYDGPLNYTRVNHAGRQELRTIIKGSVGVSGAPTPSGTDWSARVEMVYDKTGMRVTETDTYLYASGWSTDASTIVYDDMGRRIRTVDATGTITRTVFDERGMVSERWVGTDDTGLPGSPLAGSSNMVKVEAIEYDSGSAGGNGYMTKRSQDSTGVWSGGVGDRVTTYAYDYRGRMCLQANPVSPHTLVKYDNSNRAIATGQYSSVSGLTISSDPTASTSTNRVTLSETAYDERGQVYASTRWQITQANGNKGSSQVTDNWYDASGRLVKTIGSQITKTAYDRLGRAVDRFVLAYTDDSTTYSASLTVTGDLVLEQTHSALDPATGRSLATWLVQRAHDDTSAGTTGALDTNADTDNLVLTSGNLTAHARPQIASMWYDDLDRVSDTVMYGTNGGSTFTRSGLGIPAYGSEGSPPAYMRTNYAYDDFGRTHQVKDAAQVISQTDYDFAGRKSKTTDNYVDGTPGGGTYNDQDRVTEYVYTAGLVSSVTRKMPSSGDDQETDYEYNTVSGVSSSSVIKSLNLLTRVVYPEQVSMQADTDRDVIYVYNALSQVTTTTDPAGNVITTTYDNGGRVTQREATTIAGGFDSTVTKIVTTYEARGMVNDVQQKNGGGTVKDEVALTYDGWGNLSNSQQDPDSAISGGGRADYSLTWTYAINSASGCNHALYLTAWTQPGGTPMSLAVTYLTGLDADVCRPSYTKDGISTVMGEYSFLGASTVVGMDYYEPKAGTGNWLYAGSGSSDYTTYMDRFNRVILDKWSPGIGNSPDFINLAVDYDVQGNATTLADSVLHDASTPPVHTFDALISYDSLRRVYAREEGELTTGAISTRARIENTGRNLAGRITADGVDLNGNTSMGVPVYTDGPLAEKDAGEMNDTRTYNKRNELTGRSYLSNGHTPTPVPVTLTYDLNGNLTSDGETYDYVYNPWGQLVQIKNHPGHNSNVQAVYTYNGLGQRISEQLDCNDSGNSGKTDGVADSYDPVFYIAVDPQGRRVATFRDTDTYPKETFVYHVNGARGPSFTGGVQLRDRNASLSDPTKWATETASSTRGERFYYCTDMRGNVSALVDSSGNIQEQYRYSPSGVPYGIPKGNMDSTGTVKGGMSGADYLIVDYDITHSIYEARADLDLSGTVTSADRAIVAAADGLSTGRGKLSVAGVANCLAFGGLEGSRAVTQSVLLSPTYAYSPVLGSLLQSTSIDAPTPLRISQCTQAGLAQNAYHMCASHTCTIPTTSLLTNSVACTVNADIHTWCMQGSSATTCTFDSTGQPIRPLPDDHAYRICNEDPCEIEMCRTCVTVTGYVCGITIGSVSFAWPTVWVTSVSRPCDIYHGTLKRGSLCCTCQVRQSEMWGDPCFVWPWWIDNPLMSPETTTIPGLRPGKIGIPANPPGVVRPS